MSELLPCPFCGGEARFEVYGGTACAVVCQTCHCGTQTVSLSEGDRAVEAWNRRAGRTCRQVMPPYEPGVEELPVCSACGGRLILDDDDRYCSHCGARVE